MLESLKNAVIAYAIVMIPFVACSSTKSDPQPPPSPPPTIVHDGGLEAEPGPTSCDKHCQRRRRLGCPLSAVVKDSDCEAACQNAESRVPGLLRTWCTSEAQDCEEFKLCSSR